MRETHRGIPTNTSKRFETMPKTITNRLGQKSISLPRIDDKKRWAGYPGIAGVARKVATMIPPCRIYCEPFAGTAKVYQELITRTTSIPERFILNDTSKFVRDWLRKNFRNNVRIMGRDFVDCVKLLDSKDTVFVFDQPWNRSYYMQNFSSFNRKNVKQYDEEVLELCKRMEGKFIITTRKENKTMLNSGFRNMLIESEYVVSGKYPKVLITTNIPDKKSTSKRNVKHMRTMR